MLATLDSIYQYADDQNDTFKASVWVISDEEMQDDVVIKTVNSLQLVTVNRDVFANEESEDLLETKKRLLRIIAQFITEDWSNIQAATLLLKDGTDRDAIELVLKELYGLSIFIKIHQNQKK